MQDLEKMTLAELKELAKENNVKNISKLKKEDLITVLSSVIRVEEKHVEEFEEEIPEKREPVERKYDANGEPIVDYKLTNENDVIINNLETPSKILM